jgi:ATP-dependent exoDNAse (exonuclease V) beta subunit
MSIPDAEPRKRALDPAGSFIVQAPAGSGKTELLIQRYLTLLTLVDQPEAVVAITFTKKAAGEMHQRVVKALRDAAGPRPVKEHEALTWELARAVRARSDTLRWELFQNPGRLRIRTIDSLCASLTSQMPWLSRLGAPPDIVEDARDIYAEAARRTIELLETPEWSEPVAALLVHLDNDFQKLRDLLANMLARRDRWLRHVVRAVDAANARAALESALGNVIRESVEEARTLLPPDLVAEVVSVVTAAGSNLLANGRAGAATACAGMVRLPEWQDLDAWLGIVETLLIKTDGAWRSNVNAANGFPPEAKALKQRWKDLIGSLRGNESLRRALAELRRLPDTRFAETQWQALDALVQLLPMAVAQLKVQFQQRGEADFTEMAMAAQRALGEAEEPTDLALSLDYQIRHLLVDEFQDTSVSQYSLLEKLTAGWVCGDGRTIFAVGDPMQSIYRFREAEVGLFLKACSEGIGGIPLELLRLSANFRSDKGIVDWVNATFPSVLPSAEEVTTGAIPFCPSVNVKPAGPLPVAPLHPFIGRDDAREAAQVVELVREAREGGAKVAILVRARNHLKHILPALRVSGLRFRAVDTDSLAEQPLIRDLTSLIRALLHRSDRIAWLSVLRAPWCGLTLGDLHALVGAEPHAAVWDLLSDGARVAQLGADARERLTRVHAVLATTLSQRPASLRTWVESAWLALGGPACTADPADRDNAEAFFGLMEKMDDGGRLDVAALTRRIEDLHANPDPDADDGLQVMTIHKAKGLEFDVVILPGLGRKTRSEEARLMLWLERPRLGGEPELLMAPIHATGADRDRTYDYLKLVDARKSEYEAGRMLYVAATRAKSKLHLLGHVRFKAEDGVIKLKPESNSLLERIWSVAGPEFEAAVATAILPAAAADSARKPQAIQRLVRDWRLPVLPQAAAVPPPSTAGKGGEMPLSFRWVGDTLRHIGTVVHQMLRRIAQDGIAVWSTARIQQLRAAYGSALLGLGVPAADLSAAMESVTTALVRALNDERGRWLLGGDHEAAACEYPLSGIVDGELVNARIDRTFIDEHGTRWIIDYKSSSHEGSGVEAFLDSERERYHGQLERYRRLFTGLEDHPIRMALYFPLLGGWREVEGMSRAIESGNSAD